MLAGSLTEAGLEAPASILSQKLDIETLQRDEEGKLKTEIDPIEVFTDTAIASTLGLLAGAQTARKEGVAELERKLASKRTPEGFYKAQRRSEEDAAFLEAFEKQYDKVSREYDIHEGRKRLDEVGKPTDLTNSKIRNDVNQRAIDIAKYVMLKDPAFRPKQNEQVTDAIVRVFKSIGADEIDDDLLVNAMAEYGLTKTDFVQMVRASATDTAQYLNTLSQFSKYLNTLKKEDPEEYQDRDRSRYPRRIHGGAQRHPPHYNARQYGTRRCKEGRGDEKEAGQGRSDRGIRRDYSR